MKDASFGKGLGSLKVGASNGSGLEVESTTGEDGKVERQAFKIDKQKKIKINKKHHFASNTPFYFLIYCNVLACMLPIQLVRNFCPKLGGGQKHKPPPRAPMPLIMYISITHNVEILEYY